MKNHFFIPYFGNKREEVETIYDYLVENTNINKCKKIIEPFCGTSAVSFYISLKHPKKYKYILNDNNQHLIKLYEIFSDEEKTKNFINKINLICFDEKKNFISKEKYQEIKKNDDEYSYFIMNRFYQMRTGLYPISRQPLPLDMDKINKYPVINFLRTEDIEFSTMDAMALIKKNNYKTNLIIADPPYLLTECQWYYENPNGNVYEYLASQSEKVKNLIIILEYNWIIKLLFRNIKPHIYEKTYNGIKKKKVQHAVGHFNFGDKSSIRNKKKVINLNI